MYAQQQPEPFRSATTHLNTGVVMAACNCYGGPDRGCFGCPLRRDNGYTTGRPATEPPYLPRHAKPKPGELIDPLSAA